MLEMFFYPNMLSMLANMLSEMFFYPNMLADMLSEMFFYPNMLATCYQKCSSTLTS